LVSLYNRNVELVGSESSVKKSHIALRSLREKLSKDEEKKYRLCASYRKCKTAGAARLMIRPVRLDFGKGVSGRGDKMLTGRRMARRAVRLGSAIEDGKKRLAHCVVERLNRRQQKEKGGNRGWHLSTPNKGGKMYRGQSGWLLPGEFRAPETERASFPLKIRRKKRSISRDT